MHVSSTDHTRPIDHPQIVSTTDGRTSVPCHKWPSLGQGQLVDGRGWQWHAAHGQEVRARHPGDGDAVRAGGGSPGGRAGVPCRLPRLPPAIGELVAQRALLTSTYELRTPPLRDGTALLSTAIRAAAYATPPRKAGRPARRKTLRHTGACMTMLMPVEWDACWRRCVSTATATVTARDCY